MTVEDYQYQMTGVERAVRNAIRHGLSVSGGDYETAKSMALSEIRKHINRDMAGIEQAIQAAKSTENHFLLEELQEVKQNYEAEVRTREEDFIQRFNQATERVNSETGEFIRVVNTSSHSAPESDFIQPEEITDNPEVTKVAQKCYRDTSGEVSVESEHPMVEVGVHTICTGPDKHYNPDSPLCYHEIAEIILSFEEGTMERTPVTMESRQSDSKTRELIVE